MKNPKQLAHNGGDWIDEDGVFGTCGRPQLSQINTKLGRASYVVVPSTSMLHASL